MGRLLALPLPIALLENLPFALAAEELTFAYARVRPIRGGHEWLLRRTPAALALPRGLKVSGCLGRSRVLGRSKLVTAQNLAELGRKLRPISG